MVRTSPRTIIPNRDDHCYTPVNGWISPEYLWALIYTSLVLLVVPSPPQRYPPSLLGCLLLYLSHHCPVLNYPSHLLIAIPPSLPCKPLIARPNSIHTCPCPEHMATIHFVHCICTLRAVGFPVPAMAGEVLSDTMRTYHCTSRSVSMPVSWGRRVQPLELRRATATSTEDRYRTQS